MKRKPHVVVFFGGDSGNADLSSETGYWMCQYIPRSSYQVTPVRVTADGKWQVPLGSLPSSGSITRMMDMLGEAVPALPAQAALERLLARPVDAFFTLVRGVGGDDGTMHSLGEVLHIPTVGSSASVARMTYDKNLFDHAIRDFGGTPYNELFKASRSSEDISDEIRERFVPPFFLKPVCEEGSTGVCRVDTVDDLQQALSFSRSRGDILLQEHRPGVELSMTVYEDASGEIHVLPPTVVVPKKATFYDRLAKRREGRVELHSPKRGDNPLWDEAADIARDVYDELGCLGATCIDMIADEDGVDVLEANTIPTLSAFTPLAKQLKAAGLHPARFVDGIIRRTLDRGN